jgi:predicted metal-dependent peptidase
MENKKEITKALQSALFYLSVENPFDSGLLQEMDFRFTQEIPTACLKYSVKTDNFQIEINPEFFMSFDKPQQIALLHHEIMHFTHQHIFRTPHATATNEDKFYYNIAQDIAINQYIKNLPDNCVKVEDWVDAQNQPLAKFQTMEYYFQEIFQKAKKQNQKQIDKYKPYDSHEWELTDGNSNGGKDKDGKATGPELTPEDKEAMLKKAQELIKRTIEKTVHDHSMIPGSVKDLMEEIETLLTKIDYKGILKRTIKKTLSISDREETWRKPNRRYGSFSPGTITGKLPSLTMFIDTSGSISHTELSEFLKVMNGFLKVGSKNCNLGLWHTELYYLNKYKLNSELDPAIIQSGGTDLSCVFDSINQTRPNLSVILTDGYYGVETKDPRSEVIWIISGNGTIDHPKKNLGKTIKLEALLNG